MVNNLQNKATADKNEADLNKILDMDGGARFIGELGIGNNFAIKKFTKDILFDEKIGGTIHIALGRGYKETLSKSVSALHWDMIKDLRNDGELRFDNKIVTLPISVICFPFIYSSPNHYAWVDTSFLKNKRQKCSCG